MSAHQGPSAADKIRHGTGPMYQHMRGTIVTKGRVIEEICELLIVHLTYGAELCPIGFYGLSFTDKTTVKQWWHFQENIPLLPERARSLVDLDRLSPHERRFLEMVP